jgi:hypothetical protein
LDFWNVSHLVDFLGIGFWAYPFFLTNHEEAKETKEEGKKRRGNLALGLLFLFLTQRRRGTERGYNKGGVLL